MKCTKCGTEFEDGKLFCPECGKEVQWVPEFNTLETIIQQRELQEKEKKKREEQAIKERKRIEQEIKRKKKKRRTVMISAVAVVAAAGFTFFYLYEKQNHSFDFQLAQAESEFSNKDYTSALKYLERALELQPDSAEANILKAKIHIKNGEEEKALPILKETVAEFPDNISAYGELLRLYESRGEADEIKDLMDNCTSEEVKDHYSDYITNLPVVSLDSGVYEQKEKIFITDIGTGCQVYYTLDGTEPDKTSTLYNAAEGILLEEEKKYNLKYVSYNEKGIPSEVGYESYTIEFKAPNAPVISPSSGQYEYTMTIEVSVPENCKAYYAFNETATTESTEYTGPVSMPVGENIFSAILVDENGKVSSPASATYVIYQ